MEITTTGLFTVNFNKPILKPPLKLSTEARRILQETALSKLYDVKDFFSIKVQDSGDDEEDANKSIVDI